MVSWREEYIESLKDRDKNERLDYELIDAYTILADRIASLEAEKAVILSPALPGPASKDSSTTPITADITIQLKSDLAEALRAKGRLQSRIRAAEDELERLRLKNKADSKLMKELSTDRAALIVKVKDRDEELKGKAKLLEDVQDEMITLNLQLNLTEQRSNKLQRDNKDLVDRWMARKGQEADAMNKASNFL